MLLLAALLSQASAGTFYFADIGLRGYARAGAYVASVDDITAQWYNPAALTRVEKGMFGVNLSIVEHYITFDREDYPGGGPLVDGEPSDLIYDPVENNSITTYIPHGGVAYRFGKLTTYVGFTSPYADYITYPGDGGQRYSLIDSSVLQTFTGGVLAYKVNDWLSIGFGASWNILEVKQSRKLSMYIQDTPASETEDPTSDVVFDVGVRDSFGIAWNLSTLIEPPSRKWAFGLMVQPPTHFEAEGTIEADFSDHFLYTDLGIITQETAVDERVTMDVSMPLIIRTGAAFRPKETIELELAFVWENWSSIEALTINELDLNLDINALGNVSTQVINGPIDLPTNYLDSYSVRFGGEWRAMPYLSLRSGILWESGGMPQESISPASLDQDKVAYGFGGSYHVGEDLDIDFGVFQSFFGTFTVDNSEVKRISAVINLADQSATLVEDRVVGNGEYTSSVLFFGLGAAYRF